jgi:hypothetical protein
MPAREMFFTFNTKVKINKETVLQFVKDFKWQLEEYFNDIKTGFNVFEINEDFLKEFIKVMKEFKIESEENIDPYDKKKIVKDFIFDIIGNEEMEPTTVLGIRYLYDEWEYEGCGREDHYYYTFSDDDETIKKTIKEVVKLVKKLGDLGIKAELNIEYDGKN